MGEGGVTPLHCHAGNLGRVSFPDPKVMGTCTYKVRMYSVQDTYTTAKKKRTNQLGYLVGIWL